MALQVPQWSPVLPAGLPEESNFLCLDEFLRGEQLQSGLGPPRGWCYLLGVQFILH